MAAKHTAFALAFVLTGCMSAPQPIPETPPVEQNEGDVAPQQRALRSDSHERVIRQATLRVRNRTCDGLGTGSGFVLDERSLITNRHVVENATQVQLTTWDGQTIHVDVVSAATSGDLAIIQLDKPLPSLEVNRDFSRGDTITVVGYPGGQQITFESGEVLGSIPGEVYGESGNVIRIDAPVVQGNSGGPVLNEQGEVIGVVFAFEVETEIGLAIDIETLDQMSAEGLFEPVTPNC